MARSSRCCTNTNRQTSSNRPHGTSTIKGLDKRERRQFLISVHQSFFVLSWNRPIYLWVCLDSLYRHTRAPHRIVLADNHSSDPLVARVIEGFERRGLFTAVHRCSDNDPRRFERLIEQYWDQIGDYLVLVEGDIEILPCEPC